MVFVGFMEGSKAVRFWDKGKRSIKVSRNVSFNENEKPQELEVIEVPGLEAEGEDHMVPASNTPIENVGNTPKIPEEPKLEIKSPEIRETRNLRAKPKIDYRQLNDPLLRQPSIRKTSQKSPPDDSPHTKAPKATTTTKERANLAMDTLWKMILEGEEFAFRANEEDLLRSYDEAIVGDEGEKWKAAMDEEINTLGKMGTWKLEDLPADRKPVGCKWVFLRKQDEHGQITKYKARLVAQGFSQKPGIDYNNDGTFALVMRFEMLCTLLAYSAINDLKLRQFDVKGAYLHGRLTETIYMTQPPGYTDGSKRSCLLLRSLYGLKQAGNVWNQELNRVLDTIGFTQLKTDYCCYIKRQDNNFTILLIWVDNFISMSMMEQLNNSTEQDLKTHFDIKSLGVPRLLLGMQVRIKPNIISLTQTHYIEYLLEKY